MISEVDANPDIPILFCDGDNVCYPVLMLFLPDESGIYKLFYFSFDIFQDKSIFEVA